MNRSLVYAYGCGSPLAGWEHALAEQERCTVLWDELVDLEQTIERETLHRACDDEPAIQAIVDEIALLSARLAESPDDTASRQRRRELYREQRELLKVWRKSHRDVLRELESRRQAAAKIARQQTDAYWGNYNRVMQSYETGRAVARQFGRRLRKYDIERDDGVLAVQFQRTRSGLGAAPEELRDGSVSALQISNVPSTGRRSCVLEMRVDTDGNTVRLPVWMHRPLPADARVKSAQLVWRRRGPKLTYRLCLSISVPMPQVRPVDGAPARVSLGWVSDGPNTVVSVAHRGRIKSWSLPGQWIRRVETCRRMQHDLDAAMAGGRERWGDDPTYGSAFDDRSTYRTFDILQAHWGQLPAELCTWYRQTRNLWKSWSGLRTAIIDYRRDHYRTISREIALLYPALELPELDLAAIAKDEQGEAENSLRHQAAIHTLRLEIIHQATKAGVPVLASGKVVNETKDDKSGAWERRKAKKSERSQTAAQETECA